MKGKITYFNQERFFGFIMGENGTNYFFHASDTNFPFEISKNKMVNFNASSNQKGLCAKNIVLGKAKTETYKNIPKKQYKQSHPKKKKFVRIGNITVNLNDVKSAQVQGDWENAKLLIRTYSSGILVEYYYYDDWYSSNPTNHANRQAQNDLNELLSQLQE